MPRTKNTAPAGVPLPKPVYDVVRYTKLRDGEVVLAPIRQYVDDAGFDLTVSKSITIAPGAMALLTTGIALALPPAFYGLIWPRSATFQKKLLMILPSMVDAGYRGELFIQAYNPTTKHIMASEGERVAQLVIHKRYDVEFQEVGDLPPGKRGNEGFGSTEGFRNLPASSILG